MPTYCLRDKSGVKEVVMSVAELDASRKGDKIQYQGKLYDIDIVSQAAGPRDAPSGWPRVSEALGVHPGQIIEERSWLKSRGVDCEFNSEGQAIVRSQAHQRQLAKAYGIKDRGDYYG